MIMLFVVPISVTAPRLQLFFWYFLNQVIMWELWTCWVVKLKTWQNFKKHWDSYFEIIVTSMQSTPTITKYIIGKVMICTSLVQVMMSHVNMSLSWFCLCSNCTNWIFSWFTQNNFTLKSHCELI